MSRISLALVLFLLPSSPSLANSSPAKSPAECNDEPVKARLLVLHIAKEDLKGATAAVGTMKGVILVESVPDTQIIRVFAGDFAVTAERLVKFLHLGGYQAREANEKETQLARNSMRDDPERVVTIRSTGGSPEQQEETKDAAFPNTIAGRIAKGYIEAFNSGNAETLHSFELKNRSKTALETRKMDERVKQYQELFASWGILDVKAVEHKGEREITVEIYSKKNDTGFRAAFELEDGTDKLNIVRFMPSRMSVALPDATPDPSVKVTSIAESIEPLRARFNKHKGKPRFVAILSPT